MNSQSPISRRLLLRRSASILGVAALSPAVTAAILRAPTNLAAAKAPPKYFSSASWKVLREVSDFIIPATNTPGAVEAAVPQFVDRIVGEVFAQQHRQQFIKQFDKLAEQLSQLATPADRLTYVEKLDRRSFQQQPQDDEAVTYRELKELVVAGYYTSEVGASQELSYDPVPNTYENCILLDSVGSAWTARWGELQ